MPDVIVSLVSKNRELVDVCREALRQFEKIRWRLILGRETARNGAPDLCIWDYEPGEDPPLVPEVSGRRKDLYLVSPTDLLRFRAAFPSTEGKILLKPVTHAVLRAFLGSIVAVEGDNPQESVDSIRAERDLILQWALQVNLKLQQYDRERTDFLARAAHELRTPLTALAGFSGLVASEQLGPVNPLQKEVLTRMEQSVARISRMASSLFRLSLGQQVDEQPQWQPGNLQACIDQAIHETTPLRRSKHILLSSDQVRDPDGPLLFDPSQMEQVLVNLLDNAVKVTPVDGVIEVRGYPYFWERRWLTVDSGTPERRANYAHEANSYRVDIEDNGPGVPDDCLDGIFEEYTRRAPAGSYAGGGLGLAICKRILQMHSGWIWAEPKSGGALFSFVLPYTTH